MRETLFEGVFLGWLSENILLILSLEIDGRLLKATILPTFPLRTLILVTNIFPTFTFPHTMICKFEIISRLNSQLTESLF